MINEQAVFFASNDEKLVVDTKNTNANSWYLRIPRIPSLEGINLWIPKDTKHWDFDFLPQNTPDFVTLMLEKFWFFLPKYGE